MAESLENELLDKKLVNVDKSNLGDLDMNDDVEAQLYYSAAVQINEHLLKKQAALKSMRRLLDLSEKYSAYCNDKISTIFKESEQERVDKMMSRKRSLDNYSTLSLPYFKGVLKDYQVIGVGWLKTLFEHAVNGILADEMGLGKTIQVIALICHLIQKIRGPFLIVVPLSTFSNWGSEFKRFAPEIPVVLYHGDKQGRADLMSDVLKLYKVGENIFKPVVITTAHMIAFEIKMFSKITWKYLIVDEGHCLKNHNAQISKNMRSLKCLNKLILTGTPLQNNMKELWSLLNFIMPTIFKNMNTFESLFLLEDFGDNSKILQDEESNNIISSLHKILQPFMLRRLKSDVLMDLVPKKEIIVYCPLTSLQRNMYMYTIKKNIDGLTGIVKNEEEDEIVLDGSRPKRKCINKDKNYIEPDSDDSFSEYEEIEEIQEVTGRKIEKNALKYFNNITMTSPMIMFKKIVNHPYLVHTPITPEKTLVIDERLITESGKMLVFDELLKKLKTRNHKVLIFSTLVMLLDLIEEVMILRGHTYCRLDGSSRLSHRTESVNSFNSDPSIFAFLISVRAGGLGLNLTGADTVIIFDRDWNPQIDIQAQDRCHRIGQTKPVIVYSLITKNTIDDKILKYGNMKKKLEKVVIKGGKFTNPTAGATDLNLEELLHMLEKDDSATVIHRNIFSDEEWEKLLDRSDLYAQMEGKSEDKHKH